MTPFRRDSARRRRRDLVIGRIPTYHQKKIRYTFQCTVDCIQDMKSQKADGGKLEKSENLNKFLLARGLCPNSDNAAVALVEAASETQKMALGFIGTSKAYSLPMS